MIKAVCTVQVVVYCEGTWNDDVTVAQVTKQAQEEAIGRIKRIFHDAATPDVDMCLKRQGLQGLALQGVIKTAITLEMP